MHPLYASGIISQPLFGIRSVHLDQNNRQSLSTRKSKRVNYYRGISILFSMNMKKLTRSQINRIIAGVCGGMGEYLDIDPTVIRIIWVVFTIISVGAGILAYLAAWLIIPLEESSHGASEMNIPENAPKAGKEERT
jgi:phage shock protein C